jgi:single-strand DNA-binding protein
MEILIMAFNLVVLTGRLTTDAELKITPSGTSVTSFNIAVDRKVKSGEEKQADFIPIVAWRQTAEFITKYFQKGSMIGIEGTIQTRKYNDKNGNSRTAFEVIANNVQFVESKKANVDIERTPEEALAGVEVDGDLPF